MPCFQGAMSVASTLSDSAPLQGPMGKNSKSRRNRGTRRKTRGARGVGELTEEEMDPGFLLPPPGGGAWEGRAFLTAGTTGPGPPRWDDDELDAFRPRPPWQWQVNTLPGWLQVTLLLIND